MIVSIANIVEINRLLKQSGINGSVHLCDSCTGQVLRLEGIPESDPMFISSIEKIKNFFSKLHAKVILQGGIYFSVD